MSPSRAVSAEREDPFEGTSSQDTEIDEQLMAVMEERIVRQLHDYCSAQLTSRCEGTNKAISAAWEKIQEEMAAFQERKKVVFATLKKLTTRERAIRVIHMGLDKIVPSAYQEVMEAAALQPKPFISPVASPQRESSLFVSQTNPLTEVFNMATNPRKPGPAQSGVPPKSPPKPASATNVIGKMKRTGDFQLEPATPSKKPKMASASRSIGQLKPKNKDLQPWEVEETDYVFSAPDFGPGYYALRCNLGLATKPKPFTKHPFESGEALAHFNHTKNAKCHDSSRGYDKESIMINFGHRVVGDEVNDEWVKETNERLTRDGDTPGKKTPTGSKSKGKQAETAHARRGAKSSLSVPVADM